MSYRLFTALFLYPMENFCAINREPVYSYSEIEKLRRNANDLRIMPQKGCQEKFLASNADILFVGGNRGGGKSFALLLEVLKDIKNKNTNCLILRNEKGDLENLINKSYRLFNPFGKYNKSINDMTWYFNNGGKLGFSYFSDTLNDFKVRFQGKEYNYIGVDEITHISYEKFKYLITCNRNAFGLRNRFLGSCNPDSESWVYLFIQWWLDDDGFPIPERDGKVRFCFMNGDNIADIYWGDSPEEVYEQCSGLIDGLWREEYEVLGFDKMTMFIKSVSFIKGDLAENIALITSDPNYVANLAQQGDEQRMKDLLGCWKPLSRGSDLIKTEDMERFFTNTHQTESGMRRASCDIAFEGGDNLVLMLWIGNHIEDIFVCRVNGKEAPELVRMKLKEWGVLESNFVYDLNGIGQSFKGFFPNATGFNNMGVPIASSPAERDSIKYMYSSLKSQCAYMLIQDFLSGAISINPRLLDMKFSGNGYKSLALRHILLKEKKALQKIEKDTGFAIIDKKTMKRYVGHSPDFIESMIYKKVFDIKQQKAKPRFTIKYR